MITISLANAIFVICLLVGGGLLLIAVVIGDIVGGMLDFFHLGLDIAGASLMPLLLRFVWLAEQLRVIPEIEKYLNVPLSELASPSAHAYRGPWRIPADRIPPGLGSLTIGELLNRYDHPPQPQA